MNIRTLLTVLALTAASTGAYCQTTQKVSAGKASEYGLIYNLPVTTVDICLTAELSESQPGEFHNYARRHLGISDAITESSREARLTGVEIATRGVADPNEQWLAQFKNGSTPYMILGEGNIPLAINTEAVEIPEVAEAAESTDWSATPLDGEAARQAVTADMARSSSLSKRAELAAQRIFELREMRSDILSGQADNMPADGAAMNLVLENIAAQEAALTAMFTGTRRTRTVSTKVSFTPDTTDVNGRVIARLSAVDGLLDADNLAGAPITLDFTVLERGELPLTDKGEVKTFPRGGFVYRIPGRGRVAVSYAGAKAAEADLSFGQLGVVFGLNPALFTDKREPSKATFDATTGALIEIGPADTNN